MKPLTNSLPLLLLIALTTCLWSCSPSTPPDQVASTFWAAALTDDLPVVHNVVLPSTFVAADFDAAKHHRMFTSVVIGKVTINSDGAHIDTRLHGVFFGVPGTVRFDTVAVIHQGEWRIDYGATASRMIGAMLGNSVDEVGEEMRGALKTLAVPAPL